MRLDLDAGDMEGEVARHRADLGASVVATHHAGEFRWTIGADPDGNEFCVTTRPAVVVEG